MAIDLNKYCGDTFTYNNLEEIKLETKDKLNGLHDAMGNLRVHLAHAEDDRQLTCALRQVIDSAKLVLDVCEHRLSKIEEKM